MKDDNIYYGYCPKCGNVTFIETKNEKCNCCNTNLLSTPYTMNEYLFGNSIDVNIDKKIFDEYIKGNPQFDEDLYIQRENKEKLLQKATLDKQRETNKPKCPTCGSTNVRPISSGKKALGFLTVGIFSSSFGKSYECENCKYKW